MRRPCVVAAILAFGLLASAVGAPGDNLLSNGGFDSGASSWIGRGAEGVKLNWTEDGGREATGALHVKVEPDVPGGPWIWWGFVEKPPTDSALKISGWIRGKGVERLAAICVQAWAGKARDAGFATTETFKHLKGDFGWTYVETVLAPVPKMDKLAVLAFTVGSGEAWFDDLRVERSDEKPTAAPGPAAARPGLSITRGQFELAAFADHAAPRMLVPMPMSYREQVPLTYELSATPADALVGARVYEDVPGDFVVEATFRPLKPGEKVQLAWRSLVLCGERSFDDLPEKAPIPATWPEDAARWLRATACVQCADPRFVAIGEELRRGTDDVREILRRVEVRAREIRAKEKGNAATLDALTALDQQGSCTSCANLVAALLRSAGVPARVVAGTPLWSGPLQTHYVVEAFVPGYGWYLIESTMLKFPTQPFEQIEVCVVPPAYEDRSGRRPGAMGGVPFLSLDERRSEGWWELGTVERDKNCGHVAEMVAAFPPDAEGWNAALAVARPRWAAWLKAAKLDDKGRLATPLQPDDVKATTAAELAKALAR